MPKESTILGIRRKPASHALDQILHKWLHTNVRGAYEFILIGCIVILGTPTPRSVLIGSCICAVGFWFRIWAAGYGYKLGELHVVGPYRFLRHPYFLGNQLLFLAFCVASANLWITLIGMSGLLLIYQRTITRDERRWQDELGPIFQQYRRQTGTLIPTLIPAPRYTGQAEKPFRISQALLRGRHRELDALVGSIAGFGILYFIAVSSWRTYVPLVACVLAGMFVAGRIVYYYLENRPHPARSSS